MRKKALTSSSWGTPSGYGEAQPFRRRPGAFGLPDGLAHLRFAGKPRKGSHQPFVPRCIGARRSSPATRRGQFVLPLAETVDAGLVQGILGQHAVR